MLYWIDGSWIEASQAKMPVSDLSVQRGIALFESVRTYNGKPFRLKDHILRITNSAEKSGFVNVPTSESIQKLVAEGLDKNYKQEDLAIRIMITAGSGSLVNFGESRLIIMFDNLNLPSRQAYDEGICLVSYTGPRFLADRKHTDYYSAAMGLRLAQQAGADDILYKDDQQIYETATGNIFCVMGNKLHTPSQGILPGLTRNIVIEELAPKLGLTVEENMILYEQLLAADELFITGSLKEVLAVTKVDDHLISSGAGEVTKNIMKAYRSLTV